MTAAPARDWTVANQAYLNAALAELRGVIAQGGRGRDRAGAGGPRSSACRSILRRRSNTPPRSLR